MNKIKKKYYSFFHINEIESDIRLQWYFAASCLNLILFFSFAWSNPIASPNINICPEYFQTCNEFIFFPSSTSSWLSIGSTFFFFCLYLAGIKSAIINNWISAHFSLLVVTIFKIYFMFFTSTQYRPGPEYFSLLPTFIFLFSRFKVRSILFLIPFIYFACGMLKLHDGWISGELFVTFERGIPFSPDFLAPILSNAIILMELSLVWLLWLDNRKIKSLIVSMLFAFHIYSFNLIGPMFITVTLPLLYIFYNMKQNHEIPRTSKTALSIILYIFVVNMAPLLIPGNHRYTGEGAALSTIVYDSERISISETVIHYDDGTQQTKSKNSITSSLRYTRPWWALSFIKEDCKNPKVTRISWKLITSLDGNPFREVVNVENACSLNYNPFSRNDWIKTDTKAVGYPGPRDGDRETYTSIYQIPQRQEIAIVSFFKRHWVTFASIHVIFCFASLFFIFVSLRKSFREIMK